MLRKGVMALFVVVAISAIIIGAFAITSNKNSSNNLASNQLTPLNAHLNNTSSANSNVAPVNTNNTISTVGSSVNNGETSNTNGKVNSPNAVDTNSIITPNKNHLSSVTTISPAEAQEIAAQYIEQARATPGAPDLVRQDGKKVYIVPVMLNNTNVGEINIDAQDGSNLGGAGGVKT